MEKRDMTIAVLGVFVGWILAVLTYTLFMKFGSTKDMAIYIQTLVIAVGGWFAYMGVEKQISHSRHLRDTDKWEQQKNVLKILKLEVVTRVKILEKTSSDIRPSYYPFRSHGIQLGRPQNLEPITVIFEPGVAEYIPTIISSMILEVNEKISASDMNATLRDHRIYNLNILRGLKNIDKLIDTVKTQVDRHHSSPNERTPASG
jgi:hypothetical protein